MSILSTRPTAADAAQACRVLVGLCCRCPIEIDKLAGKLPAEAFGDLALYEFFELLVDMRQASKPTKDANAVAYEAKRRRHKDSNLFEAIGGAGGYARLVHNACLSDSVKMNLSILNEAVQWQKLASIQSELAMRISSGSSNASEVQQWLQEEVHFPLEGDDEGPVLLSKTIRKLALSSVNGDPKPTIKSGFPSLDALTGGWLPGNYIVLAARPSVGKSALGFQMCCNAARRGAKVLYVSIEMTDDELGAREISASVGLNVNDVLANRLERTQRAAMLELADNLDIELYTWSPSSATVPKIEAHVRCLQASGGCDFIGIDYLSLLDTNSKDRQPNWERVMRISKSIKQMAKRLKIPVLVLSQVNRESEKGGNSNTNRSDANTNKKVSLMKRPTLADLAQSGSIEQDADVVMFVHRETRQASQAELILAKGRNIRLARIELDYDGPAFRFTEKIGEEFA